MSAQAQVTQELIQDDPKYKLALKIINGQVEKMDTLSWEITELRRQTTAGYAEWYRAKESLDELVHSYEKKPWFKSLLVNKPNYDEVHFAPKKKFVKRDHKAEF